MPAAIHTPRDNHSGSDEDNYVVELNLTDTAERTKSFDFNSFIKSPMAADEQELN